MQIATPLGGGWKRRLPMAAATAAAALVGKGEESSPAGGEGDEGDNKGPAKKRLRIGIAQEKGDGGAPPFSAETPGEARYNSLSVIVTRYLGGAPEGSSSSAAAAAAGQTAALSEPLFPSPHGIVIDPGNHIMYISDTASHVIRSVGPDGTVMTLAGTGKPGAQDGPGVNASFDGPKALAVAPDGSVLVADAHNHRIRRVTLAGEVSTLAGTGERGYRDGGATSGGGGGDSGGDNEVGDGGSGGDNRALRGARFASPGGCVVDAAGMSLLVADTGNNCVRRVSLINGSVGLVAGSGGAGGGFTDGTAEAAQFRGPQGLALDAAGNLFVCDTYNHAVRKITPAGQVTTMAGTGESGFRDGPGREACFSRPTGIAVTGDGSLVVSDTGNSRLRLVAPDGAVSTLAGDGNEGFADGLAPDVKFWLPTGVAFDGRRGLFVCDTLNLAIRSVATTELGDAFSQVGAAGVVTTAAMGGGGASPSTFPAPFSDFSPLLATAKTAAMPPPRVSRAPSVPVPASAACTDLGAADAAPEDPVAPTAAAAAGAEEEEVAEKTTPEDPVVPTAAAVAGAENEKEDEKTTSEVAAALPQVAAAAAAVAAAAAAAAADSRQSAGGGSTADAEDGSAGRAAATASMAATSAAAATAAVKAALAAGGSVSTSDEGSSCGISSAQSVVAARISRPEGPASAPAPRDAAAEAAAAAAAAHEAASFAALQGVNVLSEAAALIDARLQAESEAPGSGGDGEGGSGGGGGSSGDGGSGPTRGIRRTASSRSQLSRRHGKRRAVPEGGVVSGGGDFTQTRSRTGSGMEGESDSEGGSGGTGGSGDDGGSRGGDGAVAGQDADPGGGSSSGFGGGASRAGSKSAGGGGSGGDGRGSGEGDGGGDAATMRQGPPGAQELPAPDVVFHVEHEVIGAHCDILIAKCDYLRHMLGGPNTYHSRDAEGRMQVTVANTSAMAFRELLTFLYTDNLDFSKPALVHVMELGRQYVLPQVVMYCEQQLIRVLHPSSAIQLLCFAHDGSYPALRSAALTYAAANIRVIRTMHRHALTLIASRADLLLELLMRV